MKARVFDVLPEKYKPVSVYSNVNILKMVYKYLKKETHLFWEIELGVSKKQEKQEPEEKVIKLNSGEINQNKSKFIKGTCNKFVKYGHRASYF